MKYLGVIIPMVVMLTLIAGTVMYLANRFALFIPSFSHKRWVVIFIIMLVVSLCGIMTASSATANSLGKYICIAGSIICGVLIFLLLATAVTDILYLIFNLSVTTRLYLSVGLTLLITIYSFWNASIIRVQEVTIPIKGLTTEIRALHLTDVHLGNFRGENNVNKIVRKIEELNPDVIFNTGDMFESKTHFKNGNDPLKAFRTLKIPHFFVYGNHDEHAGVEKVIEQMRGANTTVLLNEIAYFGELQIIGLNNMPIDRNTFELHASPNSETIEETLNKLDIKDEVPTIVLHHRPDGVKYMQEKGTDLLLAGHTHAGQIFPFTIMAKLMFGYNKGLYKYEDMDIYVSEGIGTIFLPARLGTHSNMTIIRLIPEADVENSFRTSP